MSDPDARAVIPVNAVLYRDDDVAALFKPSGLLVHNSAWAGPREQTLMDAARATLGDGWHPAHRLDRGTSGLVLFARDVALAQAAMSHGDTDKRYWALVRGHVRVMVDVNHPVRDDDVPDAPGRPARSVIRPLLTSSVDRCSLVEVQLMSGRKHQARRHLKHVSHPVLGDATHGKGPLNRAFRETYGLARLALHARTLTLPHPITGARLHIVAPLPEDLLRPLFMLFGHALRDLLLDTDHAFSPVVAAEVSR